ncbi:MAG: GAF domain-containing protein [Thermodesulfobacteriota bacterium]|nr:GAF domain-containing protein [Thermodesulfobacteriota bacterium]
MTTKQIAYFKIFHEVSRAILSVLDSKEVLELIVKRVVPALKLKAASLRLLNEETNDLELAASRFLSKKYLRKGLLAADKSVPEVLKGKPILILDAQNDPRIQYRNEKAEEGIASILSVPVQIHNQVIGMLRLYTSSPRSFTEDEIEFVSAICEMAGLGIINARMYEKEKEKLARLFEKGNIEPEDREKTKKYKINIASKKTCDPEKSTELFRILHEVTRDLVDDLNPDAVVDSMVEKSNQILEIKGCSIFLLDETTGRLNMVSSKGISNEYLEKGPLDASKSMSKALEGEIVYVKNVATDKNIQYQKEAIKEGIVSILSVPIFVKEHVIGEMRFYSENERAYNNEEIEFILASAEIGGIAITNAKFYQRLKNDIQFWESTLSYLDKS